MSDLDHLRYPVGKFSTPAVVSPDDINRWIRTIENLAQHIRDAVKPLNELQLDTPYREGGWTIRQVVHHLPDSHVNAYVRFKLALTEDNPTIRPYMEERWAELPDGKSAPIENSLDVLDAIHKRWVTVLRNMNAADFKRTFYHPENKVTRSLEVNLALYEWHSRHHLAHITELKKRMGW
ncbi:MAG: bacillithiol transferase BstA [Bacteroidetes bacterium]|nr:bacillithiol transferase BstA [Bacteroidota bacterium]